MHWQTERRLIDYWRTLAATMARNIPPLGHIRVEAVVYRRALGVADGSGDSERLKPLVDGLVDAGVVPNDRRREVEYGSCTEQRLTVNGPGIMLLVYEVMEV